MSNETVAITRVANSCVLLEIGGHVVLTDPFFTERWYVRRGEPLGIAAGELPPLTAIVVSNPYLNHWDLRGLRTYRHPRERTPVYTSSPRMARRARALGYAPAAHLPWGRVVRPAPGLVLHSVGAGRNLGQRQNAYVIEGGGFRVFFGGEIQDPSLVARYREEHGPVDIALLPVNGLRPIVGPPIVMGPAEAVAGAKALGAGVLVPVHDAMGDEPFSRLLRRHGSGADARTLARADPHGPEVVCLGPGERREFTRRGRW
ncbi:MBL fold metallo-hydrolase [Streptomyces sp. NPDC091371]|uniref:MBL fold metallo-hydrolase n=1 Tax=Streptomyces sp. NPDC091371 TaxID=3155303 RepID=UPI0034226361